MNCGRVSRLTLVSACLIVTTQCTHSIKSVKLGDYTVQRDMPTDCAVDKHMPYPQRASRIFYKSHRVTGWSMGEFVSPYNPARLIFDVSPSCGDTESQVGFFYFEPSRQKPVKIAIVGTFGSPQETDAMWSPDDKFIVLGKPPKLGFIDESELRLVNLATGESTDLSRRLYIRGGNSHASFHGWSPDGKLFALVVESSVYQADGSYVHESDLISFNPATMTPTYLATMRKEQGWVGGNFRWVNKAGENMLAIEPSGQSNEGVYVKPGGPVFDPMAQLPL